MRKRFLIILLAVILLAMACGCQQTPEKSVVVSKNDGAFENALQSTNDEKQSGPAQESTSYEEQSEPAQELTSYSNTFTSSDGKITYDVQRENIDLAHGALPVLQVTPMTFTSEQAQHVAQVLFGDATVNEQIYDSDGIPYSYVVTNQDEQDYRDHSIRAYVDYSQVSMADIYSTVAPTDEDKENARSMAETILEELQMGEWVIDSCSVFSFGMSEEGASGATYHQIDLAASPVYNGQKIAGWESMNPDTNGEDASAYYDEYIYFTFSGGKLINFTYQNALEVVDVVDENVSILSFDEIIEHFETQMEVNVLEFLGLGTPGQVDDIPVPLDVESATVKIMRMELGLIRTNIPDNPSDFYLVPCYIFYGTFYNKSLQAMDLLTDYKMLVLAGEQVILLVINAVDGSVIDVSLGY